MHRVVKMYSEGTALPSEMVFSISECPESFEDSVFRSETAYYRRFPVRIIKHQKILTHGPNRQAGGDAAEGDIVLYHDADDFSHPQRVEIVRGKFNRHDIVHLNHLWIPGNREFDKEYFLVEVMWSQELFDHYYPTGKFSGNPMSAYGSLAGKCHGGPCAVLKEVLAEVKWKEWGDFTHGTAEDSDFCLRVLEKYNKSIILKVALDKYTNPGMYE